MVTPIDGLFVWELECRPVLWIAEVEYCRFMESFRRIDEVGDLERERDRDREPRLGWRIVADGRGPMSLWYFSKGVGGLKMSPETMILAIDSRV